MVALCFQHDRESHSIKTSVEMLVKVDGKQDSTFSHGEIFDA